MQTKIFVGIICLALNFQVPAQATLLSGWQTPTDLLENGFQAIQEISKQLNLLEDANTVRELSPMTEAYDRRKHFGTWVKDPQDSKCFNTRAKVLIRDSESEVQFHEKNPCSVQSGTWRDPYTGDTFFTSDQVQVDHLVPLKQAYLSGGWKWSPKKRCRYANFIANPHHLLTVSSHENLSKGDSTPEAYLPPNRETVCSYLKHWLKVKMIWSLEITQQEKRTIENQIDIFQCNPADFFVNEGEIKMLSNAIENNQSLCSKKSD